MLEKCGRPDLNAFHLKWIIGTHRNWKNQNNGGRFGATILTALLIQPIYHENGPYGLLWQCCLACSTKTAPQDFDFFNCHLCQTFILAEIHCQLSALKNWQNNLLLSGVCFLFSFLSFFAQNTYFRSTNWHIGHWTILWIFCLSKLKHKFLCFLSLVKHKVTY